MDPCMAMDPYPQHEVLEDRPRRPSDPAAWSGSIDRGWAACVLALATLVALVLGT